MDRKVNISVMILKTLVIQTMDKAFGVGIIYRPKDSPQTTAYVEQLVENKCKVCGAALQLEEERTLLAKLIRIDRHTLDAHKGKGK